MLSASSTSVRVTLPVLTTMKSNRIWSPASPSPTPSPTTVPVFDTSMDADGAIGTVTSSFSVIDAPPGAVPEPLTTLSTTPASMSACVSAYVAVAVTTWPGARTPSAPGHE